MRQLGVIGSVLLAVLLLAGPGSGAEKGQLGPLERRGADAEFVPGELIVQFRPGVSRAGRTDALAMRGARVEHGLGAEGLTLVRLPKGSSVRASAALLSLDPRVAFAEPNHIHRLTQTIPNDPTFDQLWGMHQGSDADIDAPEAWDRFTGSSNVRVGVIDSGVAYDHPDLMGNIWVNTGEIPGDDLDNDGNGYVDDIRGWDFLHDDPQPADNNGHGTHVAGTIGAVGDNLDGVVGVNWDVSIMALRAGDADGSLSASAITEAIIYACENGAHVVNGSFGSALKNTAMANAVKSTVCRNTLFVFAAGNDGANLTGNTVATNAFPCELHRPVSAGGAAAVNVLCVGASTHLDTLSSFSNRGPAAVHLVAPGGDGSTDILSTWPEFDPTPIWGPDGMEGTQGAFDSRWGDRDNIGTGTPPPDFWTRSAIALNGSFSLADSPSGVYPPNIDMSIRNLEANPIDLSGGLGCILEYPTNIDVESDFDIFGVVAGGDVDTPDFIGGWSGTSNGTFVLLTSDLSAYDGDSTVFVRFFLGSDNLFEFDGVYVDDVLARCLLANGEDYEAIPGTSMASPHVAGVAALLLDAMPALTVAKLKNALLKGVDKKAAFANHVSTGGRLNADRSLDVALDVTPPNTQITARPPASTRSRRATFRFRSTEAGSTLQCRHMNGAWLSCKSPKVYANLKPGLHRFRVRAIDRSLNVDPTPAADTWRIRR